VEPCYSLQNALKQQFGLESGVITGKDSKEALSSYNDMKTGDSKIIFATIGCVSTGVSISDLDNIVLISPVYTNELLLKQMKGRLMRTFPGKEFGTFIFVYDPYIFPRWKLGKFIKILKQ
jgi:superfamily II DNA or RNA helicase